MRTDLTKNIAAALCRGRVVFCMDQIPDEGLLFLRAGDEVDVRFHEGTDDFEAIGILTQDPGRTGEVRPSEVKVLLVKIATLDHPPLSSAVRQRFTPGKIYSFPLDQIWR